VKKGRVWSEVPMVAAAARAVTTAPNLRTKSKIASPFLNPPFTWVEAAIRGAVPLAAALVSAGISTLADILA